MNRVGHMTIQFSTLLPAGDDIEVRMEAEYKPAERLDVAKTTDRRTIKLNRTLTPERFAEAEALLILACEVLESHFSDGGHTAEYGEIEP